MIHLTVHDSPLGVVSLAEEEGRITHLWLPGQEDQGTEELIHQADNLETSVLIQAEDWLDRYFDGLNPVMNLPLHASGTAFQEMVWQILQTIPYGQTMTYGQVAKEVCRRMGCSRMSAQAVGQAVGHNPIAILIPCHRVLGKNGALTGYAGGLAYKKALLKKEGSI